MMEKGIAQLDFPKIDCMIQIHDYNGVSMFSSTDKTKAAARETVKLFGDHYPELLHKKFFINVPWYMSGFYAFLKPIIPERTSKKFVICSSDYHKDIRKSIPIQNIPVKYGGMSKTGEESFTLELPKKLSEVTPQKLEIGSRSFENMEVPVEKGSEIYWEFLLHEDDIEFACSFVEENGKFITIENVKKIGSQLTIGKYKPEESGKIKFVWDNNFSIFTSKTLYFRYVVV